MTKEIATIEPLRLPDVRRLATMPCLPAWVASRIELLREELQKDPQTGRYRKTLTLPTANLLSDLESRHIAQHVRDLRRLAEATPQGSSENEAAMLVIITKMLFALSGQRQGEVGGEARGEAYMAALDDVPVWAVAEAIRHWYRGECGPDHAYQWAPAPAVLRAAARIETWKVLGRAHELERLLLAEPLVEYSDEYRAKMLEKLQAVMPRKLAMMR